MKKIHKVRFSKKNINYALKKDFDDCEFKLSSQLKSSSSPPVINLPTLLHGENSLHTTKTYHKIDGSAFLFSKIESKIKQIITYTSHKASNSFIKIKSKIKLDNNNLDLKERGYNSDSETERYENYLHQNTSTSSESDSFEFKYVSFLRNTKDNEIRSEYNLNNLEKLTNKEKLVIKSLIDFNEEIYNKKDMEIYTDIHFIQYNIDEKARRINSKEYTDKDYIYFDSKLYFLMKDVLLYYYLKSNDNKITIGDFECNVSFKHSHSELNRFFAKEKNLRFKKNYLSSYKTIIMCIYDSIALLLSNLVDSLESNEKKLFLYLYYQYKEFLEICKKMKNDCEEFFKIFEKENKGKIYFNDILIDLFWDQAFKIYKIRNGFINLYLSNDIKTIDSNEDKQALNGIIDILYSRKEEYKKNIGITMNLPYVKKKSVFLMDFILKNKYLESINHLNGFPTKKKNEEDVQRRIDILKENKVKNDKIESFLENLSLDEIYNYIQTNSISEAKANKKRHKKRKKNNKIIEENNKAKEDYSNNSNKENNEESTLDPVVEEYRQYFKEYNKRNINCIKIKPVISKEWIKSII